MLRARLLLALAPEPACGARAGDGAGAHAACCRPERRPRHGRAGLARRRVRHPGDRRGQVPVLYSHPRGAGRARTHGTPVARHRHRDARSLCGGPGAAHGRPVPAARCTAPRRHPRAGRSARRHDRPPARQTRQTRGMRHESEFQGRAGLASMVRPMSDSHRTGRFDVSAKVRGVMSAVSFKCLGVSLIKCCKRSWFTVRPRQAGQ